MKIFCRQLWAAAASELRGNKTIFLLLVGLPLVYTLLFGATYSSGVLKEIPLAVCDMENTQLTRLLTRYYGDADRFRLLRQVSGPEELEELLRRGEVKAGFFLPAGSGARIKYGQAADAALYVDAANVVYGNASISAMQEINATLTAAAGQRILERLQYYPDEALRAAYPVRLRTRVLHNAAGNYSNFMLLGLVCNGIQIALYLYAPSVFSRNRRLPAGGALPLLAGKLLALVGASTAAFAACLALAHYLFFVPLRASCWQFAVLLTAFATCFTALALLFGLLFSRAANAISETLLFIMPGLLYSGLSWPGEWTDSVPKLLSCFFPIKYIALSLRSLSLRGEAPGLARDVAVLLLLAALFLALDYLLLQRRLKRGAFLS